MKNSNEFDWFSLVQTKGIGIKASWDIFDILQKHSLRLSDLLHDYEANSTKLPLGLQAKISSYFSQNHQTLTDKFAWLQSERVKILHIESDDFPRKIKRFGRNFGIPPLLFARGYTPLANSQSISIVGSRNVEDDSVTITAHVAKGLTHEGFNIVSGYAKGVDTTAHLNALNTGGTTTIVLSLGILNFEAKKEIRPLLTSQNTLVLSQFNPSDKWAARNAMIRNKLVCSLSDALVVIASGSKIDSKGRMSGTFDAATNALEMNIPVFVISPNFFAKPPIGNGELIKMGCTEISPQNSIDRILSILHDNATDKHKQGNLQGENFVQSRLQLDI